MTNTLNRTICTYSNDPPNVQSYNMTSIFIVDTMVSTDVTLATDGTYRIRSDQDTARENVVFHGTHGTSVDYVSEAKVELLTLERLG